MNIPFQFVHRNERLKLLYYYSYRILSELDLLQSYFYPFLIDSYNQHQYHHN